MTALNELLRGRVDALPDASLRHKFGAVAEASGGLISPETVRAYYYGRRGARIDEATVRGFSVALEIPEDTIWQVAGREHTYLRAELLRAFRLLDSPEYQFRAVEAVRAVVDEMNQDRQRSRRRRKPR